jgi:hypothetical protein
MKTIDYIKLLEEANLTLITDYLEDNYVVLNNSFVNKHTMESEWGYNIIEHLEPILSLKEDYLKHIVKCWAHSKGLFEDKWDNSYMSTVLKTVHYPNIQIELERLIGMSAEKQMIYLLSEELRKEIDLQIINELKKKVVTFGEFENLMKCLGYVFTETMYDANTFKPLRRIKTTTEYDKMYEQQNNPYWKDWFRARGQNQET